MKTKSAMTPNSTRLSGKAIEVLTGLSVSHDAAVRVPHLCEELANHARILFPLKHWRAVVTMVVDQEFQHCRRRAVLGEDVSQRNLRESLDVQRVDAAYPARLGPRIMPRPVCGSTNRFPRAFRHTQSSIATTIAPWIRQRDGVHAHVGKLSARSKQSERTSFWQSSGSWSKLIFFPRCL